jgi:hypothetical protein
MKGFTLRRLVDLRRNKRYRLKAPITFSWESRDGAIGTGEGHTRDISVSGVFIVTAGLAPEGSVVRMEVNLPPLHPKGQRVCLRTQGRVLRTEHNGFAAMANMGFRMEAHEIENSGSGLAITRKDEHKKRETVQPGWVS